MEEKREDPRILFQTEEQSKMVDDFLTKITQNRGHMGTLYTRMEKEQKAYSGDQELKDGAPNSRVNIINANVEGQLTALVEQNLSVMCRGQGPSDQNFANWARIGLDWTLRQNHIKKILDRHERRRLLFGWGWKKVWFDPDALNGFGLARIETPPLNAMFVDMKITDVMNLHEADYIAEVMPKSKTWADSQEQYKHRAKNIYYGGTDRSTIFSKDRTMDDEDIFWLVQLWTKTDGMLRKIEFSEDGVFLYDSFDDAKEPYYRYNRYPYFLTNLYYEEGELYGFGDGKLLRPLQDMLNDLYDQIRRQARPPRIFFDPNSNVDLDGMDETDEPIPCDDPTRNIYVAEIGRVNPGLWQLLQNIHQEIQRVTRYSELMMGQGSSAKTATESAIQQQQGNSATDHKKLMLQDTLEDVCKYVLDLMIENYEGGKMFRIDEDKNDYEWIEFEQLDKVPQMKPGTDAYARSYLEANPNAKPEDYKWMQVESGETKSVELDIEISIGAGLPKNKAFLYQMVEQLAPLVIEGKPVISWPETRKFIKDFLGMPLGDDTLVMPAPVPGQPTPGTIPNADATGLTAGGGVQADQTYNVNPVGGVM